MSTSWNFCDKRFGNYVHLKEAHQNEISEAILHSYSKNYSHSVSKYGLTLLLPLTRWKKLQNERLLQNEWLLVFLVQKLWSSQDISQIFCFKKAVDIHYLIIDSISLNDCHFQTNWAKNLSNHSDLCKFFKVYEYENHLLIILKLL